ncbi:serine/threonine-protein kinase [Actinomadura sp. KC06]|uniref:serine/threonine-protein kinase n=1 Tax=Actinomadura sp. KC06 TaxID=2530369 RepID=UPI001A9D0018|nr:serine/threonine-protein kinase [Actinomadura sp. KC06]
MKELGAGAQGRVVLARRDESAEIIAIKYLAARPDVDTRALRAFRGEAETLARVTDPNIARLHDYVESPGGEAAIVMEAVDGVSLRRLLDDRDAALPAEAALAVLKGSLLGLAAAHAVGVVHRDYKPANVIVDAAGRSKLIDFGIAVLTGQSGQAGTPGYMSPEQWRGEPATPATDLYAATCVFVECVTGRRPFGGGDVHTLREQHLTAPVPVDDVPEPLRPLVVRGMSKTPSERVWDAAEFVAELETTAARAYGPGWERQGRAGLAAAAAALATLFPHAIAGSAAAVGVKGLLAKIGGAKTAAAVAGAATVAITAALLLWPSPPYRPAWDTGAVIPVEEIRAAPGGFLAAGGTPTGRFEVLKLDAQSGAVQWRHPMSDLRHGFNSHLQVQGDTVVFTQKAGQRLNVEQIVAVDVHSGRVRWRHGQAGLYLSNIVPHWCGTGRVCFGVTDTTRPPSTATDRIHILDGSNGAKLSESAPLGYIPLGTGLRDSIDHKQIVRTTVDGKELWRRPISEIFGDVNPLELSVADRKDGGGPWRSISWSYHYDLQYKDGRYVGEIGAGGKFIEAEKRWRLDYATVAAFDGATGRRLWAEPGTTVFCGALKFTIEHPVRCRKTGWMDVSAGGSPEKWRFKDLSVTVEGFDPATGETRWSWRAGAVPGLGFSLPDDIEGDRSVIRIDDRTYLIRTLHSGSVLLDLGSGPRPVQDEPTGWCWSDDLVAKTQKSSGERPYWTDPQRRWWPCDSRGGETKLPGSIPEFAGARSGDVFAWPGGSGVQAVHVD